MIYIIMLVFLYGLLKVIASVAVFPAQLLRKPSYDLNAIQKEFPDLELIVSQEKTPQNRILETLTIKPLTGKVKDTVLIFNGQNATFRNEKKIRTYCQTVRDTGDTVVGFDYGGTALRRITTWSKESLLNDGVFLATKLAKALPQSSLILKGNSLGSAIATLTAGKCHEKGVLVYLWGGRPFLSVTDVAAGQIRTLHQSGHYENQATIFLSKISRPFISALFSLSDWNIDIEHAYKNIPEPYKNYYLVRSDKHERKSKKDDVVIPYCASPDASNDIKLSVKKQIREGDIHNSEDISFYRARRKCSADSTGDAHPLPEINLFSRIEPKLSAYQLFCLFATSYVRKQGENNMLNDERKGFDAVRVYGGI